MSKSDDKTIELASMLYNIADRLMAYHRIMSYPDCNTCSRKHYCQYVPKPGEQTRINCPLWTEKE